MEYDDGLIVPENPKPPQRIKVFWNEGKPTEELTYTIVFPKRGGIKLEGREVTLVSDQAEDLLWLLGKQVLGDERGRIDEGTLIEFFEQDRYTISG